MIRFNRRDVFIRRLKMMWRVSLQFEPEVMLCSQSSMFLWFLLYNNLVPKPLMYIYISVRVIYFHHLNLCVIFLSRRGQSDFDSPEPPLKPAESQKNIYSFKEAAAKPPGHFNWRVCDASQLQSKDKVTNVLLNDFQLQALQENGSVYRHHFETVGSSRKFEAEMLHNFYTLNIFTLRKKSWRNTAVILFRFSCFSVCFETE